MTTSPSYITAPGPKRTAADWVALYDKMIAQCTAQYQVQLDDLTAKRAAAQVVLDEENAAPNS